MSTLVVHKSILMDVFGSPEWNFKTTKIWKPFIYIHLV